MAARVDNKYHEEIDKARTELKTLNASAMLRLAYAFEFSIANAGSTTSTDNKTQKTSQSANNNFLETFEKIKANYPTITSPDFYQLAGVVAVKELEGPEIEFVPGRTESPISPDESYLPEVKLSPSELKDVFRKVRISEPKHIIALYGGLKLARDGGHAANLKFDNLDFKNLVNVNSSATGKARLEDQEFHNCVERYAMYKEAFFKDYKEAHKKLSEFDLPYSAIIKSKIEKSESQVKKVLGAQRAVAVVVAGAVVILSVFYVINRRRRAKHSSQQFQ